MRWKFLAGCLLAILATGSAGAGAVDTDLRDIACAGSERVAAEVPVYVKVCAHGLEGGKEAATRLARTWLPAVTAFLEETGDWDLVASRGPVEGREEIRLHLSVFPLGPENTDGREARERERWVVVTLSDSWDIPRSARCMTLERGRRRTAVGMSAAAWACEIAVKLAPGVDAERAAELGGRYLLEAFRRGRCGAGGEGGERAAKECRVRAGRRFRFLGWAEPPTGFWPREGSLVAVRGKRKDEPIRPAVMNAAIGKALEDVGLAVVDQEIDSEFVVTWDVQEYGVFEVTTSSTGLELAPLPMTLVDVAVGMRHPLLWCEDGLVERFLREAGLSGILFRIRLALVEGRPTGSCLSGLALDTVPGFEDVVREPSEPCTEEDFPCM